MAPRAILQAIINGGASERFAALKAERDMNKMRAQAFEDMKSALRGFSLFMFKKEARSAVLEPLLGDVQQPSGIKSLVVVRKNVRQKVFKIADGALRAPITLAQVNCFIESVIERRTFRVLDMNIEQNEGTMVPYGPRAPTIKEIKAFSDACRTALGRSNVAAVSFLIKDQKSASPTKTAFNTDNDATKGTTPGFVFGTSVSRSASFNFAVDNAQDLAPRPAEALTASTAFGNDTATAPRVVKVPCHRVSPPLGEITPEEHIRALERLPFVVFGSKDQEPKDSVETGLSSDLSTKTSTFVPSGAQVFVFRNSYATMNNNDDKPQHQALVGGAAHSQWAQAMQECLLVKTSGGDKNPADTRDQSAAVEVQQVHTYAHKHAAVDLVEVNLNHSAVTVAEDAPKADEPGKAGSDVVPQQGKDKKNGAKKQKKKKNKSRRSGK